jgi:hypothetical protein
MPAAPLSSHSLTHLVSREPGGCIIRHRHPNGQATQFNLVNSLTTRPSQIRWLILALLFLISIVTYIDRVNISVTARQMMQAYGITDQEMGQKEKGGS